ncbi:MAG: DNA polymerase III subunit delta' [Rhizobiales bacterium 65-79]|jgi:DNA polymerase-3 subunit delta'|nr:DNA polymerase III subunit delta' [Hyphomicrobiales bacterium]OJU02119.1 MAG: DNA polymerase III subunit delta' [Rhizobiales bacterium 65-79]
MFERLAPEQYDSIPGVPEPSENPRLIGHEEEARLLAATYRAGRLHHAILLAGPFGIGKATFAFRLAHHLLKHPRAAEAPETFENADVGSALYRQIAGGSHPSILHLTRPFDDKRKVFRTVVTVEEIRRVNRFLSMTAHDGGYRVVIVDPADDMNTNAANALLKSLEEPPSRTVFLLISHSPGRLLPTIRSRCQTVRLKPLDAQSLRAVLQVLETDLPSEPAALDALAGRAQGSARTAILLTQFGGLEIGGVLEGILAASRFDVAEAARLADAVSGRDQAIQFGIFNRLTLDAVADAADRAASAGEIERAGRLSDLWSEANEKILETDVYNLDRKQHAVGLLGRMHELMRG